jgi:hypothetical protein
MAVTLITGISLAGYLLVRASQPPLGEVIAAAVPQSGAMAVLERQRQEMILMDAASHTLRMVGSPKLAARPSTGSVGVAATINYPPPNPNTAQAIAYNMMASFGFSASTQFGCLNNIWTRESGWRYNAENPSGAYGIPQALPGDKMASAGSDWLTNPATQIRWGLGYIRSTYGTPCNAWAFWQAHGWY